MAGCERIRKLLSQLTEAQITVENLTDAGDVNFSLRRDELSAICLEPLSEFRSLIIETLKDAETKHANLNLPEDFHVFAIEILGGGVRMQVTQQVIIDVLGEVSFIISSFSTCKNSVRVKHSVLNSMMVVQLLELH